MQVVLEPLDPVILGVIHGQPRTVGETLEIAVFHTTLKCVLDVVDEDGGPDAYGEQYCGLLLAVLHMFNEPH